MIAWLRFELQAEIKYWLDCINHRQRFEMHYTSDARDGHKAFTIWDSKMGCWCRKNGGFDGDFIEFNKRRKARKLAKKWNKGIGTPKLINWIGSGHLPDHSVEVRTRR